MVLALVVAVAVGRLVPRVVGVILAGVVVAGVAGRGRSDPLLRRLDLEARCLDVLARFLALLQVVPPYP
jgi:hypothetical protein